MSRNVRVLSRRAFALQTGTPRRHASTEPSGPPESAAPEENLPDSAPPGSPVDSDFLEKPKDPRKTVPPYLRHLEGQYMRRVRARLNSLSEHALKLQQHSKSFRVKILDEIPPYEYRPRFAFPRRSDHNYDRLLTELRAQVKTLQVRLEDLEARPYPEDALELAKRQLQIMSVDEKREELAYLEKTEPVARSDLNRALDLLIKYREELMKKNLLFQPSEEDQLPELDEDELSEIAQGRAARLAQQQERERAEDEAERRQREAQRNPSPPLTLSPRQLRRQRMAEKFGRAAAAVAQSAGSNEGRGSASNISQLTSASRSRLSPFREVPTAHALGNGNPGAAGVDGALPSATPAAASKRPSPFANSARPAAGVPVGPITARVGQSVSVAAPDQLQSSANVSPEAPESSPELPVRRSSPFARSLTPSASISAGAGNVQHDPPEPAAVKDIPPTSSDASSEAPISTLAAAPPRTRISPFATSTPAGANNLQHDPPELAAVKYTPPTPSDTSAEATPSTLAAVPPRRRISPFVTSTSAQQGAKTAARVESSATASDQASSPTSDPVTDSAAAVAASKPSADSISTIEAPPTWNVSFSPIVTGLEDAVAPPVTEKSTKSMTSSPAPNPPAATPVRQRISPFAARVVDAIDVPADPSAPSASPSLPTQKRISPIVSMQDVRSAEESARARSLDDILAKIAPFVPRSPPSDRPDGAEMPAAENKPATQEPARADDASEAKQEGGRSGDV